MKIILFMATSANGMIASKDGSEDFLSDENWKQFVELATKIGCIIWGRRTYENVLSWDKKYLEQLKHIKKIILSNSEIKLVDGFDLAHSPADALKIIERLGFAEVIVTGGSQVNSSFAQEDMIDEVILDINPVIIGDGIPLFSTADLMLNMSLLESKIMKDGIIQLRYKSLLVKN